MRDENWWLRPARDIPFYDLVLLAVCGVSCLVARRLSSSLQYVASVSWCQYGNECINLISTLETDQRVCLYTSNCRCWQDPNTAGHWWVQEAFIFLLLLPLDKYILLFDTSSVNCLDTELFFKRSLKNLHPTYWLMGSEESTVMYITV